MKNKFLVILLIGALAGIGFVVAKPYLSGESAGVLSKVPQLDPMEALKKDAIKLNQAINAFGDSREPEALKTRMEAIEVYEKMGRYQAALSYIEWFLARDQSDEDRQVMLALKDRTLKLKEK